MAFTGGDKAQRNSRPSAMHLLNPDGLVQLQDKIVARFALTIYPYSFGSHLENAGTAMLVEMARMDMTTKSSRLVKPALNPAGKPAINLAGKP